MGNEIERSKVESIEIADTDIKKVAGNDRFFSAKL